MELRKIDLDNVWKIVNLKVAKDQENFVASNANSIIEAFAIREAGFVALPFGVYEGDEAVGFIMIGYGSVDEEGEPDIADGNYCIWRLMIDERFQGNHFGRKAIEKALENIRTWPCGSAEYCWLSYEPDNIVAKSLYGQMGFVENGQFSEDEIVAVLPL